jgi:predicted acyltransferase
MKLPERILTIDIMRGLTLFLMLFVNDLYVAGVPEWLTHTDAGFDGMGLADWVFPGFLFMVGMAVPFAIQSRKNKGDTTFTIVKHIFIRTLSLLFIGVLMLNTARVNPELTGMSKNGWAISMYLCIFLVWNQYKIEPRWLPFILKAAGMGGLVVLLVIFRAGTAENPGWLIPGWWGILGLIGWGYLVAALVHLFVAGNILKTGLWLLVFILLNILSQLNLLSFLDGLKPVFGVLIEGNTPSIVMSGLLFTLLLRKYGKARFRIFIPVAVGWGILFLVLGFYLRQWFIISKILGTPSWAFICNGISILLFVILFLFVDVWGIKRWSMVFVPAGRNSLTTYLAPDILYYSIWMTSLPVFFYKTMENPLLAVAGSLVWALLMVGFAAGLSWLGIRLKL